MPYLKYVPEERKVISYSTINTNRQNLKMSEKMQQQLDYIANVIHDNGFTPNLSALSVVYPPVRIIYPKPGASLILL